jgi:hypothetical protein
MRSWSCQKEACLLCLGRIVGPDLVEDLIVGLRKAGLEPDGKLLARPCDPQAGSCILRDCTQIPSYCDYGVLNQSEAVRQRQSTNCVSDR